MPRRRTPPHCVSLVSLRPLRHAPPFPVTALHAVAWLCAVVLALGAHTGARVGERDGGAEAVAEIKLLGAKLRLWPDVAAAPQFLVRLRREEVRWTRGVMQAAGSDCDTLASEVRPVVVNTHQLLWEAGLMAEWPYLFRERCARPAATPSVAVVVAEARHVWVFKHGAMVARAPAGRESGRGRGWDVVVPHAEYHRLEMPSPAVLAQWASVQTADTLVNVAQVHAHNFYHFLCEVLPRLLAVPRSILTDAGAKIVLPPVPGGGWAGGGGGFIGGLLHLLELPESCVLGWGEGGVVDGSRKYYDGGLVYGVRVVVPTYSPYRIHSQTPRMLLQLLRCRLRGSLLGVADGAAAVAGVAGVVGGRARGWSLSDEEDRWWRGQEAGAHDGGDGVGRVGEGDILVSVRGEGSERGGEVSDVQNWAEVLPALRLALAHITAQSVHAGVGGERARGTRVAVPEVRQVQPGVMTLMEQAAAFASAGAVVGAHGSNLANLVWLRAGAALVEVHRPAEERGPRYLNFWHSAAALHVRYLFVAAAPGFRLRASHVHDMARFLAVAPTSAPVAGAASGSAE